MIGILDRRDSMAKEIKKQQENKLEQFKKSMMLGLYRSLAPCFQIYKNI